jgi:aminoglycoside phosphotransferase (APT) family kinase protein
MKPGALLASGRDSDIYEYGAGFVLRRSRSGRSIAHEARIMEYAAQYGYPVPAIDSVRADGAEIVMERVDGPLMLDESPATMLRLRRMLALLADLHDQLHEIAAPDWVPHLTEHGDRLLHLDLHPLNVIMSPTRGPVVIDWANASCGEPLADVALTYVLLTCSRIPVPRPIERALNLIRHPVVHRAFAKRYRGPGFDAQVTTAAERKCLDANMFPDEIARMKKLAAHPPGRRGWLPLRAAR